MRKIILIGLITALSTSLLAQNKVVKNAVSAVDSLIYLIQNTNVTASEACFKVKNSFGESTFCINSEGKVTIDGREVSQLLDTSDYASLLSNFYTSITDSLNNLNHNDLNNIQLADSTATFGHITNATQTIKGHKSFNSTIRISGNSPEISSGHGLDIKYDTLSRIKSFDYDAGSFKPLEIKASEILLHQGVINIEKFWGKGQGVVQSYDDGTLFRNDTVAALYTTSSSNDSTMMQMYGGSIFFNNSYDPQGNPRLEWFKGGFDKPASAIAIGMDQGINIANPYFYIHQGGGSSDPYVDGDIFAISQRKHSGSNRFFWGTSVVGDTISGDTISKFHFQNDTKYGLSLDGSDRFNRGYETSGMIIKISGSGDSTNYGLRIQNEKNGKFFPLLYSDSVGYAYGFAHDLENTNSRKFSLFNFITNKEMVSANGGLITINDSVSLPAYTKISSGTGVVTANNGIVGFNDTLYSPRSLRSTSNGYIPYDSLGVFVNSSIYTNGTNVGIWTTSPTSINGGKVLEITNSVSANTTADNQDLIVKSTNRNSALFLIGKSTRTSALYFGDENSSTVGAINYDHTDNYLTIGVNGGEKIRILSNGNFGINETNPAAKTDINGDLILELGTSINEFSTDVTLAGNSDDAVPTEKVLKYNIDSLWANLSAKLDSSSVYAWAKAAIKPSYTASEIGGLGASYRWLTDSYISTWNAKEPAITKGTTAQYFRGDMSLATMPTSLPASDVYAWAKASVKPTYTYSEVGASSYSHNHSGVYDPAGTAATMTLSHESYYNHSNYNTVYSWGNHASAGYLTSVNIANINATGIPGSTNYLRGDGTWAANSAGLWSVGSGIISPITERKIGIQGTQVIYLPDQTSSPGTLYIGNSGSSLSSGSYYNTYVGLSSGASNAEGYRNTGIGYHTLYSNTTGYENTGIGYFSLNSNTTGYENISVGGHSLQANTTGWGNTAIGISSAMANISGTRNTAVGYVSLTSSLNDWNTAVGYQSMSVLTSGSYNTSIGSACGNTTNLSTENDIINNSVFVGYGVTSKGNNQTNQIIIGYSAQGNGSNTATIGDDNVTDFYANENGTATIHFGKLLLSSLNTAPSSASDTGTVGEIRIDANYIYVCIATNTWKRSPLTTW